jgi:hypothetical protein
VSANHPQTPAFIDWMNAGFGAELLRVAPSGKKPLDKGWQSAAVTPAVVQEWANQKANVGLRTRFFPVVDIDVDDPLIAALCEGIVLSSLGAAPVRSRKNSPRRALLYGLAGSAPFGKKALDFALPDGSTGKIEFLANGQQVVVSGTHPSGAELEWSSPPRADALTMISEESRDRVLDRLREELEGAGCTIASAAPDAALRAAANLVELHGYGEERWDRVEKALAALDPDASYGEWIKVGMAVHAEDSSQRGLDAWDGWSSRGAKYRGPDETSAKWRSFRQNGGIGPGTLFYLADEAGGTARRDTSSPPVEHSSLRSVRLSLDGVLNPIPESFVLGRMIPLAKASVLYGPTSVGKSAALAQIACAVAGGEATLWGMPVFPGGGPVLVYSTEDSLDDWCWKLAAIRASGQDVTRALERLRLIDRTDGAARFSEVMTVQTKDGDAIIRRRVSGPSSEQGDLINEALAVGAKLLIVETASRLVDDEDNASFSALQSALGRIARETGAAVVVTHHANKTATSAGDSRIEGMRGGSSLAGNARNVLALFPVKSGERFRLTHSKPSSSTEAQPPVTLVRVGTPHGAVFRLLEDASLVAHLERGVVERRGDEELLEKLRLVAEEILASGRRLSVHQFQRHAQVLGVSMRAVGNLVDRAEKTGLLVIDKTDGKGRYYRLGVAPLPSPPGDAPPDGHTHAQRREEETASVSPSSLPPGANCAGAGSAMGVPADLGSEETSEAHRHGALSARDALRLAGGVAR